MPSVHFHISEHYAIIKWEKLKYTASICIIDRLLLSAGHLNSIESDSMPVKRSLLESPRQI